VPIAARAECGAELSLFTNELTLLTGKHRISRASQGFNKVSAECVFSPLTEAPSECAHAVPMEGSSKVFLGGGLFTAKKGPHSCEYGPPACGAGATTKEQRS
jgi:hypothetical protein